MKKRRPLGYFLALLFAFVLTFQPAATAVAPLWASIITDGGMTPSPALPQQTATAEFTPEGTATTVRVTRDGGTFTSPDGKTAVTFPANAVPEDVDVTFTPLQRWTWGAPGMRMVTLFELKAESAASRTAVRDFSQDVDIAFQLSRTYHERELAGLDPFSLGLYTYNATTRQWDKLTGTLGPATATTGPKLTAKTRHFSVFGNQAAPVISGPGAVLGFQNDLHSGAAVARIPIEVPPGPGGFAPKLELVYNSGSVDEMKNKRDVGSWVGIGWSLSVGSVSYNGETGKYHLNLDGAGYELAYRNGPTSGNPFVTKPESGLTITNDPWQVRDRNGTYYEFGGTNDSIQRYQDYFECQQYNDNQYRWDLNLVRDVHGNEMTISYAQDIVNKIDGSCQHSHDIVSAYPSQISYGKNVNDGTTSNHYTVVLNSSSDTYSGSACAGWKRNDNPSDSGGTCGGYARVRENKRLTSVEVKVDGSLVRKYVFTYNTTNATNPHPAGQMTLTSFQQVGADGTSTLPAMSFTYATPLTYFYIPGQSCDLNANPGNPVVLNWPHLATITNGYGATVTYTYDSKPNVPATNCPPSPAGPQNLWVRAVVTQRSTNPGIGPTQTLTYSYTGDPQYNCTPNCTDTTNHWKDEYRGFAQVRETELDGDYSDHWFYTVYAAPDGKDGDKLTGKEYKTEWRNSANTLLTKKDLDWEFAWCCTRDIGPYWVNSYQSWWAYLEQEDTTTGAKTARTRYTYDLPSESPGNIGYGNLMRENRDGDTSITTDDATAFHDYNRNTTANILDTAKWTKTYSGNKTSDDGSGLAARSNFYYDGDTTGTAAPTRGLLTRTEAATSVSPLTYVTTNATYDTYGNRLTAQDPRSNTTSWTYDATYHALPVTETYPIGSPALQESATWDFGAGKVLTWTDVNGQAASYEYDTFRRLTKVVRPGDTSGSPTLAYNYNAWGTINSQNLETVAKISGTESRWSKQFFDGVGRVVQVQSKGETEGGATYAMIDGTATYDDHGRVSKQYVSQKVTPAPTAYVAPDAAWKFTQYAYDGLGRVTTQTNPDGTTVSHAYTDWQTETTNERGYKKAYANDAFGRLAKVEEKDASHALYATTTYAYHQALGLLTQVVDAASNTTSITYDALGRKTQMTDPDMGAWSYAYDANGNLTQQTDAKSQNLHFRYDALNRLDCKSTSANCAGTIQATYSYDSTAGGNVGKGRRTGMIDTPGSDAYTYDSRGRIIREDRVIDGATYTTQYAYDSADRQTSVTYPTNEVVTTTYNGRGLPLTLSGTLAGSLVTDARYNQLGQLTQIDLGNGLRIVQNFHGLDAVDGGDATSFWGRLYRIRTYKVSDSTDRQHVKHWWDAAGNLSQWKDVAQGRTVDYTYDFLDRVTGASGFFSLSVAYNAIGNITSQNGDTYTYHPTKPHAVTNVTGTMDHTYDANGNATTFGGSSTISWDVENRLTSMTDDNGTQTFAYDAEGQRMKRTRGGQTVVYANRLYEKNVTTGIVTTYYHLGGRLVAFRKDTAVEFVELDHLGSLTGSADSAGGQVASLTYAPWGKVVGWASSGTLGTDKKYTEQRDETVAANVDLFYYGARYYEPGIGRFVSPDSLVPELTNPQALNRYGYVLNNPLRYTDPTGECWGPVSGACAWFKDLVVDTAQSFAGAYQRGQEANVQGQIALAQGYVDLGATSASTMQQVADTVVSGVEAAINGVQTVIANDAVQFAAGMVVENPTNVVNDVLGVALTLTSGGDVSFQNGAMVVENAGGLPGLFLDVTGAPAFTVGHEVFFAGAATPSTLEHELDHVLQYDVVGTAFLPTYAVFDLFGEVIATFTDDPKDSRWDYNPYEFITDWY